MIPFSLPTDAVTGFQLFTPQQDTTTTRGYQTWNKPQGCTFVYFYVQCPGGGGGGGFTGAAGTARGGGGGGGSGASVKMLIPAFLLPDTLYMRVYPGGAGGAANNAGANGVFNTISIAPNTTTQNQLYQTGGNAGGGGAGTGAAAGAVGTAGGAATIGNWSIGGFFLSNGGQAGTAGGAQTGAAGGALTTPTSSLTTGGTGGGGTPTANTDFAGGAITAAGPFPALAGGVAAAGAGNNGFGLNYRLDQIRNRLLPFFTTGGTGGGTAGAAGTAGAGAPGGWGSGGGGGGAGVTGGAGGKGGDGFIMVAWW
jgi:hypothetical protein